MQAVTFCDFGQPNRKDVLQIHKSVPTAKRQFKRLKATYHDQEFTKTWRVWTENSSNQTICDTRG